MKIAIPRLMSIGYNTLFGNSPVFMIRESVTDQDNSVTRIEVLSNLSLTLDRLAGFFLALSAVTLTVALLPTLLGYWPVMAIAIVHLAIVGWCFRIAWRGHWARQDITVDPDRVRIEFRTIQGVEQHELPTDWVRVEQRSASGEPRVFLVLHGKRIEIGSFVPAGERIEAAKSIIRALEPHSAWKIKGIKETASSG
ncbi:MAG TPA: DUF2244 domain-containing protein [Wenzhouxiangellaceae bacterium]|nr:DUF2244 domain-containing protein [Wenzhouxiangellaceae bacterium]